MLLEIIIICVYSIALILIFMYALAQLNLLFNYIKSQKTSKNSPEFDFSNADEIPYVTIQLPVFNEIYVMDRLLKNIVLLDYPKDKLEIQVLDDSTDESVESTAILIETLQEKGFDIQHIQRTNREGFKAGALKEGLVNAKGEYIAIFDADFLPQTDWLKRTIPFFRDEAVGVVQTRWGHINRNYSVLTRIQAFALDAHFTLEQVGRNSKGHFINFNGTAGVWRKTCIIDAGNWEGDTLTEDLDLSYRAQLKNWKFKYLEDVETPAELPVAISAARSQQFRWNKGGAENFRKITQAYQFLLKKLGEKDSRKSHNDLKTENEEFTRNQMSDNRKNVNLSDKFDRNVFNKIYEENRQENNFDSGYEKWIEENQLTSDKIERGDVSKNNFHQKFQPE